jgi:hypothetical protein
MNGASTRPLCSTRGQLMSLSHPCAPFRVVFVALSCGALIAAQAQMQGDLDSADSNHH